MSIFNVFTDRWAKDADQRNQCDAFNFAAMQPVGSAIVVDLGDIII